MVLDSESLRVLGSLMEKEMTTPDLYPLSINSLIMAANQRSSRDPVMNLDEAQLRSALEKLEAHDLVAPTRDSGRVIKFEHRIRTVFTLRRDETAILCLLFLRGPQTPGELRSRSERMFSFEDLPQVQSALDRLAGRPEPLVEAMSRQPGSRETRWRHGLGVQDSTESTSAIDAEWLRDGTQDIKTLVNQLGKRVIDLEARLQLLEEAWNSDSVR